MTSGRPVILAVDDEPEVLNAVRRDLLRHYGKDYQVVGVTSGGDAVESIKEMALADNPLALIVADQRMPTVTGIDVLRESLQYFPLAKKTLLTAYADTDAAIRAINEVGLDHYIMKPWNPPEQLLYPILNELLDDWQADYRPGYEAIKVVGQEWSRDAHELKAFLAMNQVPYRSYVLGRDEEAETMMAAANVEVSELPLVILADGSTLTRPDHAAVASMVGLHTHATGPTYDLAIVGGGPAGLAAAVYGASEGLKTVLVESAAPGGQAGQSSLIENYLGFPKGISGADLARRASTQAARFGAEILVPATVTHLERKDPYRILHMADGTSISAKAVVVTSGVDYRRLSAEGLERLSGAGVYYGTSRIEAESHRGRPMYVVGGGNSAGQASMFLTGFTDDINIVIRSESLSATMSQYLIDAIATSDRIKVLPKTQVVAAHGKTHLERLTLRDLESEEEPEVDAGALFIFIGQKAMTDWLADVIQLDDRGFVLTGADIEILKGWTEDREPLPLETSVPGVFAAGDVRHGSIRRVAGATGEGATAIRFVHQHLATL